MTASAYIADLQFHKKFDWFLPFTFIKYVMKIAARYVFSKH